MTKYNVPSLKNAAIRAMENAESLHQDAQTLARSESYGHAVGLLIMAREEAQKSLLLTYCATGVYDITDTHTKDEVKKALTNHEYKHDSAWYTQTLGAYISYLALDGNEKVREYIERLRQTGNPKGGQLEKKKWNGLYVDLDGQGRVTHPKDITYDEFTKILTLVYDHIIQVKFIHSLIINASEGSLQPIKVSATQFKSLDDLRPLSIDKINKLESSGGITSWMAGFGRFLVEHNLEL